MDLWLNGDNRRPRTDPAQYPPEAYQDYVKWSVFLKKGFCGLGLAEAVNTEEELSGCVTNALGSMMADAVKQATGPQWLPLPHNKGTLD